MKLELYGETFEKYLNIKFNENPSSGNRVVQCERTDRETGGHDEAVTLRSFGNSLKNQANAVNGRRCTGWASRLYYSSALFAFWKIVETGNDSALRSNGNNKISCKYTVATAVYDVINGCREIIFLKKTWRK